MLYCVWLILSDGVAELIMLQNGQFVLNRPPAAPSDGLVASCSSPHLLALVCCDLRLPFRSMLSSFRNFGVLSADQLGRRRDGVRQA